MSHVGSEASQSEDMSDLTGDGAGDFMPSFMTSNLDPCLDFFAGAQPSHSYHHDTTAPTFQKQDAQAEQPASLSLLKSSLLDEEIIPNEGASHRS